MNKINKGFLRNIVSRSVGKTEKVLAAVAYATDAQLLFDTCWQNKIPLKYYGRLDAGVGVKINILNSFLKRNSANFVCKLVRFHHAKVIWWQGYGVYIGSANLTSSAWGKNIEVGCFFSEENNEVDDDMKKNLFALFEKLDKHSTPLNDEVIEAMEERRSILKKTENLSAEEEFYKHPSFTKWDGLTGVTDKNTNEGRQYKFLEEWHDTLDHLRKIGERVSMPENRPEWIDDKVPMGVQTDQFLNTYYHHCVLKGDKLDHNDLFEKNKNRREYALTDAIEWWKNLPQDLAKEADIMPNERALFLQEALSEKALFSMNENAFHEVCKRINAIKNYAPRAPNKSIGLPDDGTIYDTPQKIKALAKTIWNDQSSNGERVKNLLNFILYDDSKWKLSERLWLGHRDSEWKMKGLDIGSLGEIVGWALPDKFPPRNNRTSKALKSLGYDVNVV